MLSEGLTQYQEQLIKKMMDERLQEPRINEILLERINSLGEKMAEMEAN